MSPGLPRQCTQSAGTCRLRFAHGPDVLPRRGSSHSCAKAAVGRTRLPHRDLLRHGGASRCGGHAVGPTQPALSRGKLRHAKRRGRILRQQALRRALARADVGAAGRLFDWARRLGTPSTGYEEAPCCGRWPTRRAGWPRPSAKGRGTARCGTRSELSRTRRRCTRHRAHGQARVSRRAAAAHVWSKLAAPCHLSWPRRPSRSGFHAQAATCRERGMVASLCVQYRRPAARIVHPPQGSTG
mmetsp:Transcript_30202/g.96311  ORF Transcript_30202/g.96311 Transcript_30202/m.96311 type:complete len:241 (+) Transcript_30202:4930-5652(+)